MGQEKLKASASSGPPSHRAWGLLPPEEGGPKGLSDSCPAPGVTSRCCCSRTWSTESASDCSALHVLSTSRLASCSSGSLCPHPPAARSPEAGTGCLTATAARRGARYTPRPREAPGSSTTESSCWNARTHPLPGHPPAASLRFPGSQLFQQPHPPS